MKKIILFILLSIWFVGFSQVTYFNEDFETTPLSFTSSSNSSTSWGVTTTLVYNGIKSDSCSIAIDDTVYLTSTSFSTIGKPFVQLEFAHICKIEIFDSAFVEVSINGGTTWQRLSAQEYTGNSLYFGIFNGSFNAACYTDWQPANNTAMPDSTWWKYETFNLTSIAANQTNVKIRFVLIEAGTLGNLGNYGWVLDDIEVLGALSEIIPPFISMVPPILQDTAYGTGPFLIRANITDSSGIDTAMVVWSKNGGVNDTIPMSNSASLFHALIPPTTLSIGDTICYHIYAVDASAMHNTSIEPHSGCYQAVLVTNPILSNCTNPIDSFPWLETFATFTDGSHVCGASCPTANGWVNDTTDDVDWIADPGDYAMSWDPPPYFYDHTVDGYGGKFMYVENTSCFYKEALLVSPCLDLSSTTSPRLEFWYHMSGNACGTLIVQVYYGAQWIDLFTKVGDQGYYWTMGSVDLSAYKFITKIRFKAITGSGFQQYVALDDVKIYEYPLHNAGIVSITNPVNSGLAGVQPIKVTLENFGGASLTSVVINWKVNGILQTPYNWTGNLLSFSQLTNVQIGTYNFSSGGATIEAWTSLPNNQVDSDSTNDYASINMVLCSGPLNGNYTIGGASADYSTIGGAVSALNVCGINGPVTFNIASGTYTESVSINTIAGASSVNRVTLQSASGVNTDVIWKNSTPTYVLQLDSALYINIKNLHIKTSSNNGYAIYIKGGCWYDSIVGNIIEGVQTTYSNANVVKMSNDNNRFNTIIGNKIKNGYYGIYLDGPYGTTLMPYGNKVLNNEILNFYYGGVYALIQDSLQVNGNIIQSSNNSSSTQYGIYFYYISRGYQVMNNKITLNPSNYAKGMYFSRCNFFANPYAAGMIANNFVSITSGTGLNIGMDFQLHMRSNIIYNSISISGGSTASIAMNYGGNGTGMTEVYFMNNNLYNNVGGVAAYYDKTFAIDTCDYNNYYTSGTYLAKWDYTNCVTIASLQTASSRNAHSVSMNPAFVGSSDLHTTNPLLNGKGIPFGGITTDIDGEIRNTTTPDIGADEFTPVANDAGFTQIVSPTTACPGSAVNIVVALRNYGADTLFNCKLNWTVNGVLQSQTTYNGSLAPGASANTVIGSYTFSYGTTYNINAWPSLPNSVTDGNNTNDTTSLTAFSTSMSAGNYTIGGTSPDFATITSAVTYMQNYGVCGPVVFNIATGTYNEQILINQIPGSSWNNSITFQSASLDSSDVVISYSPNSISNNFVFKMMGADFIRLKHLTIKNTTTTNYGTSVVISNGAHFNMIENCRIEAGSSISSYCVGLSSPNTTDIYNYLINSVIANGYYGVKIDGPSSHSYNWTFLNNSFENFYMYGLHASRTDSLVIEGNNFNSKVKSSGNTYGMYLYYIYGAKRVVRNNIILNTNGSTSYGIYFYQYKGTYGYNGLIANNMIVANNNSGTAYGVYFGGSYYLDVYNNSINLRAPLVSNRGIYVSGNNLNFENNLVNVKKGYPFYTASASYVLACDYNNFYAEDGVYVAYWAGAITSISALQSASSKNAHTISALTYFASSNDLHVINGNVGDAGHALSLVPKDIDKDLRNINTPDIGADEFSPPALEMAMLSIQNPISGCGLTMAPVSVKVKNTGTDTITNSFSLKYSINQGTSYVVETVNTNVSPGDTLDYTFSTLANLTSSSNVTFNVWAVSALTNDPFALNDTAKKVIFNGLVPPSPTITGTSVSYGNTASLSASSSLPISWYSSDTSSLVLVTGANYTTPTLFDTTSFFASAMGTNGCPSLRSSTTVNVTGIPAADVGISAIYTNSGCGLDSTETVSIDIYNWGTTAVTTGLTAKFRVNAGSWTTSETVSISVPSNDTITYTFTATANLYAYLHSTLYDITAVVNKSGDPYSTNDTLVNSGIRSELTPNDPIVTSPVSIAYGSMATVGASPSNDSVYWYNTLNSLTHFSMGDSVTTGILFADDTLYCQAGGVKTPGIIFTEISVGLPDYFEIQNTSNQTINATGWKVAVSYDNTNVNSFSSTTWDIGVMQAGEVKYRDDVATGSHYYGANINWAAVDNGWAMIIDNNGNVVDFVAWGWNTAYLNFQSMNINGHYVSGASIWSGDGISQPTLTSDIIYRTKYDLKDSSEWHIDSIGNLGIANPELLFYGSTNGTTVCASNRVPLIIDVASPPANDVGMENILNPSIQVAAGVIQPIQVQIKNYGTDTLFSSNITYEVNGIVKTTYAWSDTLLPNQISGSIQIATDAFSAGVVDMRVWATLPNGVVSGVNANDTISTNFTACLSGTYSIGDSTADFLTINDAIAALDTAGVCGQVVFDIKTGTYTEKMNLSTASGMNAVNSVTFRSMTGNSNDVTIKYASLNFADNEVILLNSASFYHFKNIHFYAMDYTYGTVFNIENGSNNNSIDSCIIEANQGTSSYLSGINGTSNIDSTHITNNTFINGYYGIRLSGISQANNANGIIISNNTFTDQYKNGMYLMYLNELVIDNNIISNTSSSNVSYGGIYLYRLGDIIDISSNKIYLYYPGIGIDLYYCYGTAQGNSRTYNNAIFINAGTSGASGIRSYFSYFQEIYYNTIDIISGSAASYGLYVSSGTDNKLKNNIITNSGNGYSLYVGASSAVSVSDYNNIYTGSPTIYAYWQGARSSLSALKTASGKDAHSKDVDPAFFSNYNYKMNSAVLNNAAIPISGIVSDIDGNLRGITASDIGAYEYSYISLDAGMASVDAPVMPLMAGSNAIHASLKNFGQTTLTSATINYSVNGLVQTAYSWVGSLVGGASADSINIGSFTFVGGMNYIKVWSSSPNGSADLINYNDTIYYNINACSSVLHGNYTIGSSATADYLNFTAAVNDLNGCGIDSVVVFNVESGTYTEQIEINTILGATANHNVTFKSISGDSSLVILTFAATSINEPYTLKLNAASYITFQDMTIKSTGSSFAHSIEIGNGSSYNHFINNVIETSNGITGANSAGLYSADGIDLFNEFIGNRFQNGANNAIFMGISYSSKERGTRFIGNIFNNYTEMGLQVSFQDSVEVRNNIFVSYNGMPAGGTSAELSNCYNGAQFIGNKINAKPLAGHIGLDIGSASGTSSNRTLVANNFISITTGTQSANGIDAYGTNYTDIIFNSVNITSGANYTSCLYTGFNTGLNLVNNILYNTAGGPAVLEGMWSTFALRDYNCQYPSQYYQGSNSINVNPMFISNTDLHVTNSALKGAGTPYGGVTVDVDGDMRNATTPDIGADEFIVLSTDAMAYLIVSPSGNQNAVGNTSIVKMRIKNIGASTITSMTVGYIYANGSPVTATYTGNLQTNDTVTYTFSTPITYLGGDNSLCVYVSTTGDVNLNNDTLCKTITGVPLITPSYYTNFDTVPFYWVSEGQLGTWERGVPNNTHINAAHSSPNVWMTDLSGNYVNNIEEYLYTPYFDFSNIQNATMKFWSWYMFGSGDYGNIEYSINGGLWSTLGYMTDPKGVNWYNNSSNGIHNWSGTNAAWQLSTYDLSSFNNQSGTVRFRFHIKSNASGTANGWAIDDFSIELPIISYDAGVTQILLPIDSALISSNDSVRIRVKNHGSMPLYSIPVKYKIGNIVLVSDSIVLNTSGSGLLPDSTIDFTFPITYTVPQNNYYVCAYTQYPGDTYVQNDSACKLIKVKYLEYDAGVKRIISPTSPYNNYSSPDSIKIVIINHGNQALSSIPVEYFIDGNSISQETWTGNPLSHGDSAYFTFVVKFTPPQLSNFDACARTNLSGDLDNTNDGSCEIIITTDITSADNHGFSLWQNNPNPAYGLTQIKFAIPQAGMIHFELIDILGQKLISYNLTKNAGVQSIDIDANTLSPGVYFYSVEYKGQKLIKKMIVN